MRIKKGVPMMAGGLLLLAAALCLTGYNIWDGYRAATVVEEAVRELEARIIPVEEQDLPEEMIPDYVVSPQIEMPTMEIDGKEYIGYLSVPVLSLNLPVMSEWSYPNLKISPCRYVGSVYLDNMVLCAHNYERHFGNLKTLSPGELITFTDVDGNIFYYSVLGLEQLQPTAVPEMVEGDWDLTLFTCTVGGQFRWTLRCERMEEPPV